MICWAGVERRGDFTVTVDTFCVAVLCFNVYFYWLCVVLIVCACLYVCECVCVCVCVCVCMTALTQYMNV